MVFHDRPNMAGPIWLARYSRPNMTNPIWPAYSRRCTFVKNGFFSKLSCHRERPLVYHIRLARDRTIALSTGAAPKSQTPRNGSHTAIVVLSPWWGKTSFGHANLKD